jgi:hypothetical protein
VFRKFGEIGSVRQLALWLCKVITHRVARRREEWTVLIRDHHDGYISWEV